MNYFDKFDWETMLNQHTDGTYDIPKYYRILCPNNDFPAFIEKYMELPILTRLNGIGLLCGTDWTPLYKNRFFYTRYAHSLGVALIVWHFTHDKAQTVAGLLHDISTPVFSHVSDFRKGDALTQTATEESTARIIREDKALGRLLAEDGLTASQVEDYHIYPIADNEIPQLSADRLEYMFPSGMVLDGSWTIEDIALCYNDLKVLKNEEGKDELGFQHVEIAELYCEHFCMISHILQLNENKLALHLLGQIMNMAVKEGLLTESDFMTLSEQEVIEKLDRYCEEKPKQSTDTDKLCCYYKTFRTMTKIEHTREALPENEYFCVNLQVKQRYINPLVGSKRLSDISEKARRIIEDFKSFSDTPYGCVKLL